MAKALKVGDRVTSLSNGRDYVLIKKIGRDSLDKRRTLFDAKDLQSRIVTQYNTGEVKAYR
jgi:hypothetical protein